MGKNIVVSNAPKVGAPVGVGSSPTFGTVAPLLAANGYRPVPLHPGQKNPIPKGWSSYQYVPGNEQRWPNAGSGILTGEIVGVDIDVLDKDLANRISEIVVQHLGAAPERVGLWPKRLFMYRTAAPFAKKFTNTYRLPSDAPDAKGHRVEVLAAGQQFVAYGMHPDTKRPYGWNGTGDPLTIPVTALPCVTEAQIDGLCVALDELLAQHGTVLGKLRGEDAKREHVPGEQLRGDPQQVREALKAIPNDDLCYEEWVKVGLALKGALGAKGSDVWEEWSARSSKNNVRQSTTKAWEDFNPDRIGAGTIFRLAQQYGWSKYAIPEGELNHEFAVNYQAPSSITKPVGAAALASAGAQPSSTLVPQTLTTAVQATNHSVAQWATSAPDAVARAFGSVAQPAIQPLFNLSDASVGRFLTSPPTPRIWILKNYLPADIVAGVVAAGGTGKSQLVLQLAASVATGLPFCGVWEVGPPGEVLALLAEDDNKEIQRRMWHISRHLSDGHKNQEVLTALAKNFYAESVIARDNLLTRANHLRGVSDTEYVARLVETVRGLKNLKLIILDPASRFRGGDESSADDMTRFIEALERIRKTTGATVLIVHHVNKSSMRDGDQSQAAARGSSAFSDGIRWQMNLAGLSDSQTKAFKVPAADRHQYLSVTMTKNNYAPPQPTAFLKRTDNGVLVPAALSVAGKDEGVVLRIIAKVAVGGGFSVDQFEKDYGGVTNIFGVGKSALRGYLNKAIEDGLLTKLEDGNRKPLAVTAKGRALLHVLAAAPKNGVLTDSPAEPGTVDNG